MHGTVGRRVCTNLPNVNQAAHEVLVAQLGDGLLCLFPGGVFNNATWYISQRHSVGEARQCLPAPLLRDAERPAGQSSCSRPNGSRRKMSTSGAGNWRGTGVQDAPWTFHWEAAGHRQTRLLRLVTVSHCVLDRPSREGLTLSHKVLEVMPLDIVGQVADVDSAVLL